MEWLRRSSQAATHRGLYMYIYIREIEKDGARRLAVLYGLRTSAQRSGSFGIPEVTIGKQ